MRNFTIPALNNITNQIAEDIYRSYQTNNALVFNHNTIVNEDISANNHIDVLYNFVWSRQLYDVVEIEYIENSDGTKTIVNGCERLSDLKPDAPSAVFIIGHCTTEFVAGSHEFNCIDSKRIDKINTKECIFAGCSHQHDASRPVIVFVDNSMASHNSQSTRLLTTKDVGTQRTCLNPPIFTELLILEDNLFIISRSNFNIASHTSSYNLYQLIPQSPEQLSAIGGVNTNKNVFTRRQIDRRLNFV
jgi:hypothetical protein